MPYKDSKSNKWRACVFVNGQRGPTKLFAKKRDAISWEIRERKRVEQNLNEPQSDTGLMRFCTTYLDYARRFQPKVYDEKRAVCRRILLAWGSDCPIEDIDYAKVQSYLDRQADDRSANASNRDRKNLMAMWNWGKRVLKLKENPFELTEKRPHDRKTQYTPPTADVLRLITAATRKERVFLYSYLFTGARRSEIFRWTWLEDVNFERHMYRLGTRKNRDGSMSYEWFAMPPELYEELLWWWENRTIKNSPYVFTDDQPGAHYGKPYKVRRAFMHGLCKRAGLKPFGFHALRRFFASRLADMGKSTKAIQRMLRHKKIHTTEFYIQSINNDLDGITEGLLEVKKETEKEVIENQIYTTGLHENTLAKF